MLLLFNTSTVRLQQNVKIETCSKEFEVLVANAH